MKKRPGWKGRLFGRVLQMYSIEIRFYLQSELVYAAGEYRSDYRQNKEVVTSAHVGFPRTGHSTTETHTDIFHAARLLCTELAQNLEDPLF